MPTTTDLLPQIDDIRGLESKLQQQKAPHQRLILLDRLLSYYTYTNPQRAKTFLAEQAALIKSHPNPDVELNFHLYSAIVENQLYNYSSSLEHFKLLLDLVEECGDVKQQAEVYIDFAGTCINMQDMDQALFFLDKAGKLLRAFPDERLRARHTAREGFVQLHFANYSRAIELLIEADKQITVFGSYTNLKDYHFLILIHTGLGTIYERNDDQEKSVEAYLKAVEIAEATDMRSRLSWNYLNVGNGFMALTNLESAEYYFQKAIETHEDVNPYAKASALANVGYCQLQHKNYENALKLFKKAENQFKGMSADAVENFALIESWRGLAYGALGKAVQAEKCFTKALLLAEAAKDFKRLSSIYKDMAGFYAQLGHYAKAYEHLLQHSQNAERYQQEVNERKRTELEVKYEAEKQHKEAELLRLQAAKLQLKALRAQMNPHFLFNALNSIQNYITSNESNNAAKYLARFAKLMRQSLEYSDIEVVSLEKELAFLNDYLYINEKLRFEDRLSYKIVVDDEIEEDIIGVPTMIVQPYVENAIEHGLRPKESGNIKVDFSLFNEDTILCVVEDDGIGREKARQMHLNDGRYNNHRSRGTAITEQRLQLLYNSREKKVYVNTIDLKDEITGEARGTRVEIKIPIIDIHTR
ncbi:histidine kinase [Haliscomenobacter sp.]|uniref:tetratricopeptide repeat-containing sensor histidine kinase n=1 Tax=Haliscomenobacter sp. TaxID=2717303 RepID=UPI00336524D2